MTNKKIVSLAGIILLVVGVIVAGGLWYWQTHKKKIIRHKIEETVRKKSDGLYKVQYDSLALDEIGGKLSITSLHLRYDSLQYEKLKNTGKAPFVLFNVFIPEINIAGVQTPRALIDKEISGHHIELIKPVIEILYTHSGKDSMRNVPDKAIYQQILGDLNLIKLDSVVISGAQVITKNLKTGRQFVRFSNLSLLLLNVAVDSAANTDSTRLLFAKELNLDCEKFDWQSESKLYHYQVDGISFRSAASSVRMRNFFMRPAFNETAFAKKFSYQSDRFDLAIHDISLNGADFYRLLDEVVVADQMKIGSASFKIYRDRNLPVESESKLGDYPQQLLQKVPVKFEIRHASIKNTTIVYRENSSITHQVGTVLFANSSAVISNITNRNTAIARNNKMVVHMNAAFLNQVPLSADWTFYLGEQKGKFAVSGRSKSADATIFNPLTIPMGPAEIKSGNLKSMQFDLNGNGNGVSGRFQMIYDDFKVSLLKKEEDSVHFKKRKIASLFANIKIKNSNPSDEGDAPRVADVKLSRNIHWSMFNLVWKSLFQGVQEITGAK